MHIEHLGLGFHRIIASYGFMESPHMPDILELLAAKGLPVDIYSTSFYMGRENHDRHRRCAYKLRFWRKSLFIYLSRNAWNATSFFQLPPDRVIELGNHVEL